VLDDEGLRSLAVKLADKGRFEQAMKFAERIESAWWRSRALSEIATEMAKAGMKEEAREIFEQAKEIAGRIKDERERSEALGKIAAEMAKAGMKEEAKKVFVQASMECSTRSGKF
ncbi:MAG: hypothetical protein RMK94_06555, partial [Armatimonadota bacterium]|nr:hypothetical protein [Armatimonadota bacterium]